MNTIQLRLLIASACLAIAPQVLAACGGDSKDDASGGDSKSMRAAALSLQQAMDSSSRAIDDVGGTGDALDRLRSVLQPAIAQTSDVIGLLTPKSDGAGTASMLLKAARDQRSFLQFAADATGTRSRRAGNSAMGRTRSAGRQASSAYADIAKESTGLAGLLPSATTFNTGRLQDAVLKVNRPGVGRSRRNPTAGDSAGTPPPAAATCGEGVSVNSATSCPFGRAVRDEYESSGGASTIEVYSTVTKQSYTMTCSGAAPVVCRGGNNAIVTIR